MLRKCLESDDAAAYRSKITDIYLVPPVAGTASEEQESLKRIIEILPGPLNIWYPSSSSTHTKLWTTLEEQRRHTTTPRIQSLATYNPTDLPHHGGPHPLPTIIECGTPSISASLAAELDSLDPFYQHMTRCPDVRSLTLSLHPAGCLVGSEARGFAWRRGHAFPTTQLENLTLSGYRWDEGAAAGRLNGAEAWRAAMDWSALKRLDVDAPPWEFLDAFGGGGVLPGLEALALRARYDFGGERTLCAYERDTVGARANYTAFVASMPPLRELVVEGMASEQHLPLGPILDAHGGSLRELTVHEFERDCAGPLLDASWSRPTLGVAELRLIKEKAPRLEALTMDLRREGNLPVLELELLSTFPDDLREVTIHLAMNDVRHLEGCRAASVYDLEKCEKKELMEPKIGLASVYRMISILRGKRSPDQRGIESLKVVVGDYGRAEGGGLQFRGLSDQPDRPVMYDCDFHYLIGDVTCQLSYWDENRLHRVIPAKDSDFYFNAEDVQDRRRDEL